MLVLRSVLVASFFFDVVYDASLRDAVARWPFAARRWPSRVVSDSPCRSSSAAARVEKMRRISKSTSPQSRAPLVDHGEVTLHFAMLVTQRDCEEASAPYPSVNHFLSRGKQLANVAGKATISVVEHALARRFRRGCRRTARRACRCTSRRAHGPCRFRARSRRRMHKLAPSVRASALTRCGELLPFARFRCDALIQGTQQFQRFSFGHDVLGCCSSGHCCFAPAAHRSRGTGGRQRVARRRSEPAVDCDSARSKTASTNNMKPHKTC